MWKRWAYSVVGLMLLGAPLGLAAEKVDAAQYTLSVHVSAARYSERNGLEEVISVTIGGRHYEMEGPTSNAKIYTGRGSGLLDPGDYRARLTRDEHKTSYESDQTYEILFPDGKTRTFLVVLQGE